MYCNHCGTKNPEGSDYCFNCGSSVSLPPPSDRSITTLPEPVVKRVPPAKSVNILARIDIAGTPLVISEQEVSFGNHTLRCDEVVGIRYGIYKHYLNGIRTSQSYAIWLTDGRSTMSIECAKGFFVMSSTIEARYQEALKALYPAVIVPLMQSFLMNLDTGPGFQIGGVTFDRNGLHRASSLGTIQKGIFGAWASIAGGASVQEREARHQHLAWSEYGGHSLGEGKVYLFRNKETWSQFSLRDTWNAVCLGPLFDFLCEDGRLWQFVNQEPESTTAPTSEGLQSATSIDRIPSGTAGEAGIPPQAHFLGYNWAPVMRWARNHPILALAVPVFLIWMIATAMSK